VSLLNVSLFDSKRDVRLGMSGSGDRSADSGRQKTRLRERSWERTSYSGKFCVVVANPFYNKYQLEGDRSMFSRLWDAYKLLIKQDRTEEIEKPLEGGKIGIKIAGILSVCEQRTKWESSHG